jgi:dihydropteroate synthase
MGIVNVTPDSFYAGSRRMDIDNILKGVERMLQEGASFIDVGGYSSRPGAEDIPMEEELHRVIEPIRQIRSRFPEALISIDTFRHKVAEKALDAGAQMVNDISAGLLDQKMHSLIIDRNVPYIAMHMKGTPQNMKSQNNYQDLIMEMVWYFSEILDRLLAKGVSDILLDPGFGFAKDIEQNFYLLKHLDHFGFLDRPLVAGVSRKSMIYKTLGLTPEESLNGTTVLNTMALLKGVHILRVHDVKNAIEVIELVKTYQR